MKKTLNQLKFLAIALVFGLGLNYAVATFGPLSNPPGANSSNPINTTITGQTKGGDGSSLSQILLNINGHLASQNLLISGDAKVQDPAFVSDGEGAGDLYINTITGPDRVCVDTNHKLIACGGLIATSPTPTPLPPTTNSCPSYYPSCFIKDTIVVLADGRKINIQDVKIGDVLKGEKSNNTVLGFHRPELDGSLYSFNGGRYFVTEEHPFKTTDGWKSINPNKTKEENIGIVVTTLKVGDTLITEKGKVLIKTIDSKKGKDGTDLYNFLLDGDHTYYADGYLVHNKEACYDGYGQLTCTQGFCLTDGGNTCPLGCVGSGVISVSEKSCDPGYTMICDLGAKKCVQSSCYFVTAPSGACEGTVRGSPDQTNGDPGIYEGQSCSQFTTEATCQQGWINHGCLWDANAPAPFIP